jgi:hypothetical protein
MSAQLSGASEIAIKTHVAIKVIYNRDGGALTLVALTPSVTHLLAHP